MVSPSLEGVLSHQSLVYERIRRPVELLRVLDGPSSKGRRESPEARDARKFADGDRKAMEDYFHDLYSVFMKKLSFFIVGLPGRDDESLRLLAMLQEMIKVKKIMESLKIPV